MKSTYGDLNARVNSHANSILGIRFRKGENIAVPLGNRSEHAGVLFALAKAGLVSLPLAPKWRGREISAAITFFDVDGIVAATSVAAALSDAVSQAEFQGPIVQVGGRSGRVTFLNQLKGVQCTKLETPAFKPHP
ncbi:MAG: AMP-binding protein [Deltaproteobacteria bacterium]|nr:AMP-binding protein [Deltaproteobacteria bacterium]